MSGLIGRFFTVFFGFTLALWGLFVPAVVVQIYCHGRASVADPDFINPAMITCFFVPVGALLLAYLNVREQSKKNDKGVE
jgi:hypothetical protein